MSTGERLADAAWGGSADGFRETLLAYFPAREAEALRLLGNVLMSYAMEVRPNSEHELPPPYDSFLAVVGELRFLERYLCDVAEALEGNEIPNLSWRRSRRFARLLRSGARQLGRMANSFASEVPADT